MHAPPDKAHEPPAKAATRSPQQIVEATITILATITCRRALDALTCR
jgi:hypothetical protein